MVPRYIYWHFVNVCSERKQDKVDILVSKKYDYFPDESEIKLNTMRQNGRY